MIRIHVLCFTGMLASLTACMTLNSQPLTVNGRTAEELYASAEKSRQEGLVIDDFNADIKGWFGCGNVKESHDFGAIQASFEHESFSCIGAKLSVNDLSQNGLFRFRMKASSTTFPDEELTFKVRFEDVNGVETNYDEQTYRVAMNRDYETVVVDFSERLVAVNGDFDAENVYKVKIFFNTKGSTAFTGDVWIDEIRGLPSRVVEQQ